MAVSGVFTPIIQIEVRIVPLGNNAVSVQLCGIYE
jgi:hypothetical protein